MPILVRITTVPISLKILLKGQMHYMQQQGFDVVMISASGKEVDEVKEQEKCRHLIVPFKRNISPLHDLYCLLKLIKIIRTIKPDIVHTHTPKAGLLGMIAAFVCGVPVRMHTVAGLPWINFTGWKRYMMRQLEKLSAALSTFTYPNSFNLMNTLQNEKIGIGKMKVLGAGTTNGIDTEHYCSGIKEVADQANELKNSRQIAVDGAVWIFIGRLVKDKGIGELLTSFLKIKEEFKNDELWLLGNEEPELDPLSKQQSEIIAESKSIKAWGFQNDIRPFLAASRLLVFPSYREGFPNVPLQAASMECAMILSNINGCNEIVSHGQNGLLVTVKNEQALYSAMHKLRTETDLQVYFSKNARQSVIEKFSQQKIWEMLFQEYCYWLTCKQRKLPQLNYV